MSSLLTSIVCSLILNISIFTIIGKLVDYKIKKFNLFNFLLIIILSIIQTIFYKVEYNIIYIIVNFLVITLTCKIIYKKSMMQTIITTTITMLVLMLSDLINSIIMMNFLSIENIRSNWYLRIINNVIVAIICISICFIPPIKRKCQYFISKFEHKHIPIIILFIILIISIVIITYGISNKFTISVDSLASILIVITLVIFCYIFINENTQYNKLNDEYDSLFKCIQTFEDWIEREQLNRHEYKNQLAVLRCMTKEKKVKDKIDSIIADNININSNTVNQLKSIPNGGLKGLLYYKIVIAQNNKLNIEIDVSIKHQKLINEITEDNMKILCRLLGIYLDNAIDAAKETRKKILSIEIYEYNENINIVISNTFKKNNNIEKRNEKGYTTKGKGHGNGLFFARKMIDKNEWLSEEQNIIDNFYTQKLIIKKKKQNN